MPQGKGSGSQGQGPGTERGMTPHIGSAQDPIVTPGTGVYCICPHCGVRVRQPVGKACFELRCPACGTPME